MNIILFDKLDFQNALSISDERAFHILNILHLKKGDSFKCGVYNGGKGIGTISEITTSHILFSYKVEEEKPLSYTNLTVILGSVRPICLRRILRSASECGVKKIIICGTELGEKSYLESGLIKSGEADKIIKDGAMQSGETSLLILDFKRNVKEALFSIDGVSFDNRFILDNKTEFYKKSVPFLQDIKIDSEKDNVIAIGSERGWTDKEREIFVSDGFVPTTISSRILRSETAFITSLFPFLK